MKKITFLQKLIREPFSYQNNKKHPVAYKILTCITRVFLYARFYLLKPFGIRKIGFLRVMDEENTVLSCLESVEDFLDKIVIIYAQNNDCTIELIEEYIKKSGNKNKYVLKKYKYDIITQSSKDYYKEYKYENSLAAYYEFGFEICKKLAKWRNGFIVKIDADQIYLKNAYKKLEKILHKEKYLYCHRTYGYDGHIQEGEIYKIGYLRNKYGLNGGEDHIVIPNSLTGFVYFTMYIDKYKAYEVLNYSSFMHKIKGGLTNICWFHFDKKSINMPPPPLYKELTTEQYDLYTREVFPLFVKYKSKYQYLSINTRQITKISF